MKPPPLPDFPPIPESFAEIGLIFGAFSFAEAPNGTVVPSREWRTKNITFTARLPVLNRRIPCHKKLAEPFLRVFAEIHGEKLARSIRTYDGCYVPRHKLRLPGKGLSVHSWGIAIDLNARTNMPGAAGDMDQRVVQIFSRYGFHWGGDFDDPMHFQYALGY